MELDYENHPVTILWFSLVLRLLLGLEMFGIAIGRLFQSL
jgi:hypothetical protein